MVCFYPKSSGIHAETTHWRRRFPLTKWKLLKTTSEYFSNNKFLLLNQNRFSISSQAGDSNADERLLWNLIMFSLRFVVSSCENMCRVVTDISSTFLNTLPSWRQQKGNESLFFLFPLGFSQSFVGEKKIPRLTQKPSRGTLWKTNIVTKARRFWHFSFPLRFRKTYFVSPFPDPRPSIVVQIFSSISPKIGSTNWKLIVCFPLPELT